MEGEGSVLAAFITVSDKRHVKEVGGKEGCVSAYSSRTIESIQCGRRRGVRRENQLATLYL